MFSAQLLRTCNMYYMFGEKFANFNEFIMDMNVGNNSGFQWHNKQRKDSMLLADSDSVTLHYYYLVLASVPLATLEPLQRVQNAAARLIFELSPREHITPSLLQLHCLPVSWRIQFKLCCITHSVHTGRCPAYLTNIVHPVTAFTVVKRVHQDY